MVHGWFFAYPRGIRSFQCIHRAKKKHQTNRLPSLQMHIKVQILILQDLASIFSTNTLSYSFFQKLCEKKARQVAPAGKEKRREEGGGKLLSIFRRCTISSEALPTFLMPFYRDGERGRKIFPSSLPDFSFYFPTLKRKEEVKGKKAPGWNQFKKLTAQSNLEGTLRLWTSSKRPWFLVQ